MNLDLTPSVPESDRSLPGLRPIGLDAEVRSFTGELVLAMAGSDLFTLQTRISIAKNGMPARIANTWRNSGPHLRNRRRPVPEHATVVSLGLERGLRLTRAFVTDAGVWGSHRRPALLIDGVLLSPEEVVALLPSADAARDAAIARVADVRALYGRMLSDVAYRIENSALFDHAVATTNDFETALTLWSDVTDDTPASEVVRLAAVVKVTFDTARAQAETVGLGHLPERVRAEGRRAASIARLAANAGTDGERAAAQEQLTRILASLSLYYLPTLTRGQLPG